MPGPAGGGYTLSLAEPNTAMASLIEMERFRKMMAAQQAQHQQRASNRMTDGQLYLQQQFPQYSDLNMAERLALLRERDRAAFARTQYEMGIRPGYFG